MAERRTNSPQPGTRSLHGINALHAVLRKYAYPCTLEKLKKQAGEDGFEFRRGEPIKLRDVLELIEGPREFDSSDDALGAVFAALDERRGADRRASPPRMGRTDLYNF